METIHDTNNLAKTSCGHAFHFDCLFRWGRKHNTCPLCRGKLAEVEDEDEQEWPLWFTNQFTQVGGRRLLIDTSIGGWRRSISRDLEQRYQNRPLSQYTGQQPDPIDVDLVVQQTNVSRERAEMLLKYFEYDIVDTIMFITEGELAIPEYRERQRPALDEEYVRRNIKSRLHTERTDGYESA